jgi:GDPmannose 4,6-dehydratase
MMWRMLQQDEPDDFVIATGKTWSVRAFAELAFSLAGLDFHDHVEFDARYLRPAEVDLLLGDASKAAERLAWKPRTSFEKLVRMMVEHDLELARREKTLRDAGHDMPDFTGHDQ